MKTLRVVLADDHQMFRTGLRKLLQEDGGIKVVGQAADGVELMEILPTVTFDCIVLDLSMPNMDGLESLQEIHSSFPKARCLVLTMQKDAEHFKKAMQYGAKGYVLKDCAFEQLTRAIKTVCAGKNFVSPSITETITDQYVRGLDSGDDPSLELLTSRECDVLKLVAQGLANKNIAVRLKISIRTVETHRSHIIQKLGIKTTAGLVKYAITKGLV